MNKEEEAAWKKVNQSFYRISAEEDVFNRYYHKPLPGESIETYSAAEIYRRLKQKSPESMRNVSVQRLAQTLSAIGIERIHTRYGNLYRGFHTLHSNLLNIIDIEDCVNPCLKFEIWENSLVRERKPCLRRQGFLSKDLDKLHYSVIYLNEKSP